MRLVNCRDIRERMLDEVRRYIGQTSDQLELVIVQVQGDPASDVYVRNKIKTCNDVGIHPIVIQCDSDVSLEELRDLLTKENAKPNVTGLMLQLPLPDYLKGHEQSLLDCISWWKDVDGLSTQSAGRLWNGGECIAPATAAGIMQMMPKDMAGWNVTVVNRSSLVGKPLVKLLMDRNATVTVCHSKTSDVAKHFEQAHAVIVGIGKPRHISINYHPENSDAYLWVDVGINRDENGKLCGDIDINAFAGIETNVTPVPGGVGLLTTAQLMLNVVQAHGIQKRFVTEDHAV